MFDGPDLCSELVDEVAVVTDEEECSFERLKDSFQLLSSEKIEVVRRFVQYEEIRVTRGETRQGKAAALSAAQHADALEYIFSSKQEARQVITSLGIGHSARQLHRVEHGVVTGQLELSLCQKCDARGRGRLHVSLERGEIANEGAHERGLSRPVRTDDCDPGVTPDSQHPGTEERLAVADGERRRLHDRVARQVRCLKLPPVLLRALWRLDTDDPRKLLSSPARFLRTLPGAVAADELLGALDLDGLSPGRLFRRCLALRALTGVRGVAAAVLHDRVLLERQRAARDAIEEPAVVRGNQNCFVLLDEEPLQPLERGDVEMVRRLVEEEDVRVIEQKPRKTETRSLAAGQRRDLPVAERIEAESAKHATDRGLEIVTAGVLELVLHF